MATTRKLDPGKVTRFVIVMICLVTLGIFGRGVFDRHFFNTRMTVIPNVMNLNEKEAIKYLKEAGLKVKVIHSKTETPLELCTRPRTGSQGKRARKPGVSAMLIIELEVILADGLAALLHRDLIE